MRCECDGGPLYEPSRGRFPSGSVPSISCKGESQVHLLQQAAGPSVLFVEALDSQASCFRCRECHLSYDGILSKQNDCFKLERSTEVE